MLRRHNVLPDFKNKRSKENVNHNAAGPRGAVALASPEPALFECNCFMLGPGAPHTESAGSYDYAPGRISSGAWKVTPVGLEIGVGSGLRNGVEPVSRSHRSNMALSSCMVLWQCSMNIPPQSRNCILMTTFPFTRRR